MTLVNIKDAAKLDDEKLSKELTARERYHAEALKEIPSFLDWYHYNMLLICGPLGGPPTEYRPTLECLNYEGDIKQMRLFSNWLPATRRFIESLLCMVVYIIIDMNVDMN